MEKCMRVLALAAALALASLGPSTVCAQATPAAQEDAQVEDAAAHAAASPEADGAVFAMTNATASNRIVLYRRADDGTLTRLHSLRTRGRGARLAPWRPRSSPQPTHARAWRPTGG